MFKDKTILITGGTGSFGQSFVRMLLERSSPKKVIVFSRDEYKQHQMSEEFKDERLRFFLGDIRDLKRLMRAFQGVDIVVHAAALKQVPALEYNPTEAVKTNIDGSQNVIEAAIDNKVKRVLCVSTDKAVEPTNLYGATKLCAEKLFVAANAYAPGKTYFSVVRYGNVVGSRGSIVETLLKNASAATITHPEMTRFWITLEESFGLVSFAIETMKGGEIFVPRLPSMKVGDLFRAIAPGVEHKVTGMRPGEKMHEALLTEDESGRAFEIDKKYFVVLPHEKQHSHEDMYEEIAERGTKLPEGFVYASHTNEQQLTADDLRKIVSSLH